jgi:hypothetical protein
MNAAGKGMEFVPGVFSISEKVGGIVTTVECQVQSYRVCKEYKEVESLILPLERQYYLEQNEAAKKELANKIVALYEKGAKYDYALLKLEKNLERAQYFNLFQDLDSLPKLTVCGYSDSDALMTHSNKPALK